MEKDRPLFRYGPALLIALVTLVMRIEPMRAQERAKVEIVPILGHSREVASVAFSRWHPRALGQLG